MYFEWKLQFYFFPVGACEQWELLEVEACLETKEIFCNENENMTNDVTYILETDLNSLIVLQFDSEPTDNIEVC